MRLSIIKACTLLTLSGLVACGSVDGSADWNEAVDSNEESIINGTPVTTDSLGTPMLVAGGSLCSSTLLSDRWLLTAHHCVTNEGVTTGGTPIQAASITVTQLGGATAHGTQVFLHPTLDVALVHLDSSFLNASGRPFANPLYLGSGYSLVPGPLYCQGWGRNTFGGGSGVLRSATLTVEAGNTRWFRLKPNSAGQIQWRGDSGSACFITIDGVPRVTGVQSTGTVDGTQITAATLVSVEAFRDWAEGLMGNSVTLFENPNFAGRAQALLPGGAGAGGYDYFRLLVGNDVVSSLTVPPAWALNLYRASGFVDLMANFGVTQMPSLGSGVNDQTSSALLFGGVILYADPSLGSPLDALVKGGRFTFSGATNNSVSSLTVPMGWRVQLFGSSNFTGPSATFEEGTYLSVGNIFNDTFSSAIVEEPVEVYADPNFNGAVGRLLPGCYGWNALGISNDTMSSIFVPSGMSVTVFNAGQLDPSAGTATFTSSQSSLGSLNDKISSLCITRI